MLCPNCGSSLKPESQVCDVCGYRLHSKIPTVPKYRKTKYGARLGAILLFLACLIGIAYGIYAYLSTDSLKETVSKQIKLISSNQYTQAYYEYTSKDFQKSTSLDNFRSYVKNFAPFVKNKSIEFQKDVTEGDLGLIEAELSAEDGEKLTVEFHLIKEDNDWKILSIRRLPKKAEEVENTTATEAMVEPVTKQLQALQLDDLNGAYEGLVSQDFIEKTSLAQFRVFVKAYPILTHFKSFEYKQHSVDGELGDVIVVLNPEQEGIPIEYKLVQEDGKWKIKSFRIIMEDLKDLDTSAVIGVVREMLLSLERSEIKSVYLGYMSEEFRQKHTLDQFTQFVKENPVFFYNSPFLVKLAKKDNKVTFYGTLTSKQGKLYLIELDLVNAYEIWKINDIKLTDP